MSFARPTHPRKSFSKDVPWLQVSGAQIGPDMPFSEAADLWLNSVSGMDGVLRRVRKNTELGYRANVKSLKLFFRDLPVGEIRLDQIRKYEGTRVSGSEPFVRKRRPNKNVEPAPCPAGPKKVNQEITILKRILRAAKVWSEEQEQCHEPLPEEESDVQRALAREEQARWLNVARTSERWFLIYAYSELAFATCLSTNEIRSLRLCDIHLEAGQINVPWAGSKNRYRHRPVAIGASGDAAWHAVQWLLNRAAELGAKEPHHHLFPFRQKNGPFDPTKPMSGSGIKSLWNEVRAASGLKWFRPYDTRHTAITRLAESGVPMSVIMDMAGHISPAMTRHYTHICEPQKLRAMRQVQAAMRDGHSIHLPAPPQPAPFVSKVDSRPSLEPPPVLSQPDLQALIQAEIARQVALALQSMAQQPASTPRNGGAL